jgi:very-short-patch-repair endonuclease
MQTSMFGSPAMNDDRQRQFAHTMRHDPTDAERVLWQRLRHDVVLADSHFRRQAAIGPYIVDFVSRGAKLVIELDGGQHDAQRDADASRTREIEAHGYRVLRFWNNDVLGNLDGVLTEIQSALPPTPDPSPQGGGEPRPRAPRKPRGRRREAH